MATGRGRLTIVAEDIKHYKPETPEKKCSYLFALTMLTMHKYSELRRRLSFMLKRQAGH